MSDMAMNFAVQPGLKAFAWSFVLLVLVPIGLTILVLALSLKSLPPALLAVVTLAGLSLFMLITIVMTRNEIVMTPDEIRVRAGFYTHQVLRSEVDWHNSSVLDLEQRPGLKPGLRLNGIGLPGYRAGWYRLANGKRAFVLLTGGRQAHLALRNGQGLQLTVADDAPLWKLLADSAD